MREWVNAMIINVLLGCVVIVLLGISVKLRTGLFKELYYGMTEDRIKEWMKYRESEKNNG